MGRGGGLGGREGKWEEAEGKEEDLEMKRGGG
jgi:hypothetical protein